MITSERKVQRKGFESLKPLFAKRIEQTIDVLLDNAKQPLKTSGNKTDLRPLNDDKAWQQLERETENLSCRVKYINKYYVYVGLIVFLVLSFFDDRSFLIILVNLIYIKSYIGPISFILERKYRSMLVTHYRDNNAVNHFGFFNIIVSFVRKIMVNILTFTMLFFLVFFELCIVFALFQGENIHLEKSFAAVPPLAIVLLATLWRFIGVIMALRVQRLREEIKHWKNRSITL